MKKSKVSSTELQSYNSPTSRYILLTHSPKLALEQLVEEFALYHGTKAEFLTEEFNQIDKLYVVKGDTASKYINRIAKKCEYYSVSFEIYKPKKKSPKGSKKNKKTSAPKDKIYICPHCGKEFTI